MSNGKEFHNLIDNGKKEYLQESQLHMIVRLENDVGAHRCYNSQDDRIESHG